VYVEGPFDVVNVTTEVPLVPAWFVGSVVSTVDIDKSQATLLGVTVGVTVFVGVTVLVGVILGVLVGVGVIVVVAVTVGVGVGVGVVA
jgi:hypothetical protein